MAGWEEHQLNATQSDSTCRFTILLVNSKYWSGVHREAKLIATLLACAQTANQVYVYLVHVGNLFAKVPDEFSQMHDATDRSSSTFKIKSQCA